MAERSLSPRETARHAGIVNVKRFYRWVSKGITRANYEHDDDLDRLRKLFGLRSVGEFWKPHHDRSLHSRLRDAGSCEWEYGYAFKLLVLLRSLGREGAKEVCDVIDGIYKDQVDDRSPCAIMEPKTPAEILSFIRINAVHAYERWMERFNSHDEAVEHIRKLLEQYPDMDNVIERLIGAFPVPKDG